MGSICRARCLAAASVSVCWIVALVVQPHPSLRLISTAAAQTGEEAAARNSPQVRPQGTSAPRYTTSWIGNTFGGRNKGWTQQDIKDIAVSASGQVVAVTWWDEMHKEVAVYDRSGKNRKISGANSLACEIMDDRLFFAHTAGGQGRPNHVIAYSLVGKKLNETVISTPGRFAPILGLALSPDKSQLYVSDPSTDTIQILEARSLRKVGEFTFSRPRKLTAAPDGSLWIIRGGEGAGNLTPGRSSTIHHVGPAGEELGHVIGDVLLPQAIRCDNQGRLIIADSDATRNHIRIYTSDKGELVGTFGRSILDDVPGKVEPDKFDHLTGIGMDAEGNWYVAWNGGPPSGQTASDGQGAVLRCLSTEKELLWEALGLAFIDVADVDPADDTQVFMKNERFVMDYSKPPGQEWTWVGYTLNRRDYPNDPRLFGKRCYMTQIQNVDGRRLMVTNEMEQDNITVYRFDGEIAVPCFLMCGKNGGSLPPRTPGRQAWWYDRNGDGDFQAEEFTVSENVKWRMVYMDARGGLWHPLYRRTVVHFELQEFDQFGVPVYDPESPTHRIEVPTTITDIYGFQYDSANDRAYIAGKTARHPNMDRKEVGATIARIDNLTTQPKEKWTVTCPAGAGQNFIGLSWAGDYVFGSTSRDAKIYIFRSEDGAHVDTLSPGPEVDRQSGWHDVRQAIRAHRRADGEYLIFAEEDAYAKVIMYRWRPGTE